MNTVGLDSMEVVPNYTFDVDDMESPDQYIEEVAGNDDEVTDGMFMLGICY